MYLCTLKIDVSGCSFKLPSTNVVIVKADDTYQKLCPHLVMYASLIISKQTGLKIINRYW